MGAGAGPDDEGGLQGRYSGAREDSRALTRLGHPRHHGVRLLARELRAPRGKASLSLSHDLALAAWLATLVAT